MVMGLGLPWDVLKVTNIMGLKSLAFICFFGLPVILHWPLMKPTIDMSSHDIPRIVELGSATSAAGLQELVLSVMAPNQKVIIKLWITT
jgi:hypothetical protein